MRWLPLLVLSLGCRQLLGIEGGEVVQDAATNDMGMSNDADDANGDGSIAGHDEDSDGVPDTMDNCPTISNMSQSTLTTGESVGAACDPQPTSGDRIGAFFSFEQPGRPMDLMGGQTFEMDHATFNGGEIAMKNQVRITRASVILSNTSIPSGGANLELRFGTYSCRLGPCSGTGSSCLQAIGNNATSEVDAVVGTTFRFEIELLHDKINCRLQSMADTTTTVADATAGQLERFRVRANSMTATIDSLIVYDTP